MDHHHWQVKPLSTSNSREVNASFKTGKPFVANEDMFSKGGKTGGGGERRLEEPGPTTDVEEEPGKDSGASRGKKERCSLM